MVALSDGGGDNGRHEKDGEQEAPSVAEMEIREEPHVLILPFPTQGHLNPLLDLAHRLAESGVSCTILLTPAVSSAIGCSPARANPLLIRFRTLNLPPEVDALLPAGAPLHLIFPTVDAHLAAPLRAFLLTRPSSFSCIVFDSFMPWVLDVAHDFGIPTVHFWTASACSYLVGYHVPRLMHCGLLPYVPAAGDTDIGFVDKGIPPTLRLRDLGHCMRVPDGPKNPLFNFLLRGLLRGSESRMVLVNSFLELEEWAVAAMRALNVAMTPIAMPPEAKWSAAGNLVAQEEDRECLRWLDGREAGSVVYVAFGSSITPTEREKEEIGEALAEAGGPFLWALRGATPEVVKGVVEGGGGGYVAKGWAPQREILAHEAVGVFVTHCGWNSVTEAVMGGVAMVGCPRAAEQATNLWQAKQLGVALEGTTTDGEIRKEALLKALREVAVFRAQEMRLRAAQLGEAARAAAKPHAGSSLLGFQRFVEQVTSWAAADGSRVQRRS